MQDDSLSMWLVFIVVILLAIAGGMVLFYLLGILFKALGWA